MIDIQKELRFINEKWKSSDLKALNEKKWSENEFNEIVEHPLFMETYPEEVINAKFDQLLNSVPQPNKEMKLYCMVSLISSVNYITQKAKRLQNVLYELEDGRTVTVPKEVPYINNVYNPVERTLVAFTKEMIEADTEFYKPVVKTEENRYSVLDIIYKPYSFVLDIDWSDKYYEEILNDSKGCFCFSIVPCAQDNNNSHSVRIGRIWKAASPEENYPVEIKFFRKLGYFNKLDQEELNRDLDNKISQLNAYLERYLSAIPNELIDNDSLIGNEIDKMFDPKRQYIAEVLRVGQANAVVINDDNYHFAFDLGLPLYCFRVIENGKFNRERTGYRNDDDLKINNLDLNSIVISHWHDDHYLGMFSLKRSFYIGGKAGIVIAPLYTKQTKLAYRLVAYLIKRRKILFINEPGSWVYSDEDLNYILFRTKPTENVNKISAEYVNNDSILLLMNNTLFPGDCYHDRWNNIVEDCQLNGKGRVENIIVIHHGSKEGNLLQNSKNLEAVLSDVRHKAIICVGNNDSETENKHYHHPDAGVVSYYEDLGFEQVIGTNSDTEDENMYKIKLY